MDSMEDNEFADRHYRRSTRKRLILIIASLILLSIIIIGTVAGTVAGKNKNHRSSNNTPTFSSAQSIKAACNVTLYPNSCFSSISSAQGSDTLDLATLFRLSLKLAMDAIKNISSIPNTATDPSLHAALDDCKYLLDDAVDRLNDTISTTPSKNSNIHDIRTYLSAAVADMVTCIDGMPDSTRDEMEKAMSNATEFTSNSLALVTKFQEYLTQFSRRKLLGVGDAPYWLSASRRRLMESSPGSLTPNVTVAKDGSGDFETINEALQLVPKKNAYHFVVYIKAGVYMENVMVEKSKWNVTLVGDGMYQTIVTGSLNYVDGVTTFRTATVAVGGQGFTAMYMGFQNTAGPAKEQAVSLRSSSDHSVFYRCSFDAYQDTLYVHSLRQFYRECDIIGTVDFIFGDASAAFQNCNIRPRQPMPGQKNIVTAQGRTDPSENTGISIQSCTISPLGNVTVPTYLGRPWKNYSTTVVMETEMGGVVVPEGWLEWDGKTAPPDTIYYGEYKNTGPGSDMGGRVTWPGYRGEVSFDEANMFSVGVFVRGDEWIPSRGVSFASRLG